MGSWLVGLQRKGMLLASSLLSLEISKIPRCPSLRRKEAWRNHWCTSSWMNTWIMSGLINLDHLKRKWSTFYLSFKQSICNVLRTKVLLSLLEASRLLSHDLSNISTDNIFRLCIKLNLKHNWAGRWKWVDPGILIDHVAMAIHGINI